MMRTLADAALASLPESLHDALAGWLSPAFFGAVVALSLTSVLVTLVGIPWVVSRLPADYFQPGHHGGFRVTHAVQAWPWWRVLLHVGKNLCGVVLVLAGIAMLVLPGQGLLTLLAALFLLDFPGKRRLERYLISRPKVLAAVNRIRQRAGHPPLVL